jgi:two-component system, cell cycle response regulator CpdR
MTRILIVEDDQTLRVGVARTLRERGHEVVEAGDGEEGLACLQGDTFALVICDVAMPGLDGISMLREAGQKSLLGEARVLLMSGYDVVASTFEFSGRLRSVRKPVAHTTIADEAGALLAA